ncbi:MAG: hypothetical protein JWM99_3936 [Verrucomicrobiales bacterium]|nr:hypothetical protein [Verrucomicrobiales bacterium]
MLNYAVEPALLRPFIPNGVELDIWNSKACISMVGFLFLRTRVLGLRMPWHENFEEVNLRFYVRRRAPEGWRRGVVFIKEIVPRRLIAAVARVCYNEPYQAKPMRHCIDIEKGELQRGGSVEYVWRHQGQWNSIRGTTIGDAQPSTEGSEEEFITEHYWGYTAQRNGGCKEYRVDHPRWNVWPVRQASMHCAVASLYGAQFEKPLCNPPQSAFVATGSPVTVSSGTSI